MATTTPTRPTRRRRSLPAGAEETMAKLRERQEQELQAAADVAQQLATIRDAEATIETAWAEIGTAIRSLGNLGWTARQITDTLDLDHRRVTDLLRDPAPTGAGTGTPAAEGPAATTT